MFAPSWPCGTSTRWRSLVSTRPRPKGRHVTSSHRSQPDDLTAAIDAALDIELGPVPDEFVEEQPPNPPRPPLDSGKAEELDRTYFTRYGA